MFLYFRLFSVEISGRMYFLHVNVLLYVIKYAPNKPFTSKKTTCLDQKYPKMVIQVKAPKIKFFKFILILLEADYQYASNKP